MYKALFRTLLISIILFLVASSGQCQKLPHFLYSEIHIIPSDSSNVIYYSYRIPYNRFVFIKDDNNYSTGFRITIEVTDSSGKYVNRQTEEKKITAKDFDETISSEKYIEGVLSFKAVDGFYSLLPIISDENSNRDLRIHPFKFSTKLKEFSDFLRPIICSSVNLSCNDLQLYELTNFNGSIPFTEDNYFMIIPSKDTSINKINVTIISKEDTVLSEKVDKFFDSNISFNECGDKISIEGNKKGIKFRNFIVENFSQKLKEGEFQVYVSKKAEPGQKKYFMQSVTWFIKPFSLFDSKEAIKILKYAADKKLVDSLLNFSSDKYSEVLFNYWKKFDPTKSTEFNPLMNEFYSRVDYAVKHFSPLAKNNGADTDRGRIYIIYGKPQKVERTSNRYGRMVERWIYENPDRIFEFIEKDGTGNYTLLKD